MSFRVPFDRTMYAEYNDEHFKLYCPLMQRKLFVNIYATKKDTPIVFNALVEKYIDQWFTKPEAAKKARVVVDDFFTICTELSKKKIFPFKIRVTEIDPARVLKK